MLCIKRLAATLTSIVKLKDELPDFIEPGFGLLDHLLSLEVLTRRECNIVRAGDKAAEERSQAVLNLLKSEDQCGKFLKALQETGQQHVVNFIGQNGGKIDNVCASHSDVGFMAVTSKALSTRATIVAEFAGNGDNLLLNSATVPV